MSLKNSMKGLDIMSATSRKTEPNKATGRNLMSNIITQTGSDLRERLKTLEADLAEYKEAETSGRIEISIPIESIDRPPLLMRSAAYFKTERFLEIKESIQTHGLQDPITVRPSSTEGRYLLVKGDTRLTSYEQLLEETGDPKWAVIRARVEDMSDEKAILMMVIENRDRENVWAYDQAVFYKSVLEGFFDDDRASFMAFMGISKGWLAKILSITTLPDSLITAFPLLNQAGTTPLYNLSLDFQKADKELIQELYDNPEAFTEKTPVNQSRRIIAHLKSAKKASPVQEKEVLADDGMVLAKIKHTKTASVLHLDAKGKEGFGQFIEERLADIYEEWKASR